MALGDGPRTAARAVDEGEQADQADLRRRQLGEVLNAIRGTDSRRFLREVAELSLQNAALVLAPPPPVDARPVDSHRRPICRPTRGRVGRMEETVATTQLRSPASTIEATYRNLSTAELYEHAIRNAEGIVSAHGSLVVRTGKHTGRSPQDKFVVREPSSAGRSGGDPVNQPISEEHYDRLRARLMKYVADRPIYSQDLYIGAHPDHRRSLRVTTETAWASIFARNLFRRPPAEDLAGFAPNFPIIDVPSFKADPETEGTRSETAILLHLKRMEIIIVGTEYAGEIKKSAFTVMNYLLPDEGALPMHSSVNVGRGRRPGALLRPLRHRQDDAVGRPGAEPHRRRRARLGARGPLQLRGRLLREDDPPLADVRAGHLRHHAPLRHDPRERRPRRGRPASSTSTRSATPRTRAAPTRSSSSATPIRPA